MPIGSDTARSGATLILGITASGNQTVPMNVNPSLPNPLAVVGVMFAGGGAIDITAATFSATFGGVTMTLAGHIEWNTNNDGIRLYTLASPPTGAQNAVVSYSSMPTELPTRNIVVCAETLYGVGAVGSAVYSTPANTTNNSVATSPASNPCDRVISLHGVSGLNAFSTYNQTTRAHQHAVGIAGGDLLLGDAPGAASVTLTAVQGAGILPSTIWGAIALPMTAAPVVGDAVLTMPTGTLLAGGNVFRVASVSPERYWEIPARRT